MIPPTIVTEGTYHYNMYRAPSSFTSFLQAN